MLYILFQFEKKIRNFLLLFSENKRYIYILIAVHEIVKDISVFYIELISHFDLYQLQRFIFWFKMLIQLHI